MIILIDTYLTFAPKNKKSIMSLVITGTMAYDAIETPFGKTDKIIGGSCTYAAYSASFFYSPIKPIAVIGGDFDNAEIDAMKARGIAFDGVEVKADEKSFFWSGKYHDNMNSRDTLITDLNVLENFDPKVPASCQDCAYLMIGNLMPVLQQKVIDQFTKRPKFIILDTMNFWMDIAMPQLLETVKHVDLILVNDEEARQLSGEYNLVNAAKKIMTLGPKYVIIKKGEHGALLFHEHKIFSAPALPLAQVFDPTGAGDSFAGGFIGHLAKTDDTSFENMKRAIIMGSVMASFCVEKFGTQRMKEITPADVADRLETFKHLMAVDL
jgi:sugar/nucleoside kinase (ribokinase family)